MKNNCFIQVGDAKVSGRTPRDCERLVELAPTLANNQPVTVEHGSSKISAGTVEQSIAATEVTDRLSEQEPVEVKTPFGSFKGSSTNKIVVGGGVFMAVCLAGLLLYNKFVKKHAKSDSSPRGPIDVEAQEIEEGAADHQSFLEWFSSKYQMPSLPLVLEGIIAGTPRGYEIAMLMHLTTVFAAICFSRVRALYLDSKIHSPNLAVIIEAPWGTGKEKFNTVLKTIFSRVIQRDKDKLNMSPNEAENAIIQFVGISVTESRLVDIVANNQGEHIYIFSSEVLSAVNAMKKVNGLNPDHFRKAFDGGEISRMNKDKNSPQGSYPLYLNYTLTGIPSDVDVFFRKELQGGTPSRIITCPLPPNEREMSNIDLPDGDELKYIQDTIDKWQKIYTYEHTSTGDVAVPEHMINLDYVNEALHEWLGSQYDTNDVARRHARGRMAAIAFHAAMVYHMMFDCPGPDNPEDRKAVVDLAIYVANYNMERFLHKYGPMLRHQAQNNTEREKVSGKGESIGNGCTKDNYYGGLSRDEVKAMKDFYEASYDHGWRTTARTFGYNDDAGQKKVKRAIQKLIKEENGQ